MISKRIFLKETLEYIINATNIGLYMEEKTPVFL